MFNLSNQEENDEKESFVCEFAAGHYLDNDRNHRFCSTRNKPQAQEDTCSRWN
jgi:hypothetical protein